MKKFIFLIGIFFLSLNIKAQTYLEDYVITGSAEYFKNTLLSNGFDQKDSDKILGNVFGEFAQIKIHANNLGNIDFISIVYRNLDNLKTKALYNRIYNHLYNTEAWKMGNAIRELPKNLPYEGINKDYESKFRSNTYSLYSLSIITYQGMYNIHYLIIIHNYEN